MTTLMYKSYMSWQARGAANVSRRLVRFLAHGVAKFAPTQYMNMQMSYGLTAVCALVGDETESVFKSELICQGRKFLNAFCKSLRLGIGHLDDVGIMLFGNEQR